MAFKLAPAIFVNHGGGPLPLLGDPNSVGFTVLLRDEVKKYVNIKELKAIILVTAHWEEDSVTISSGQNHELYFDYYNFPAESYEYRYDAPGDPVLAMRIHEALKNEGIATKLDSKRGWDHGVFVPMMLINPDADVPIVQMSVLSNQDPGTHYKIGQILQKFRNEGIAILGSGMTYHNMYEFKHGKKGSVVNERFDSFLTETCTTEDESARMEGLLTWREQEGSSEAHPPNKAEHLMPLIVIAGAGGKSKGERISKWDYKDNTFRVSSYIWN